MIPLLYQGESETSSNYLFIDGEYLDIVYKQGLRRLFGNDGDLCLESLKTFSNVSAYRVYYYNALDDARRDGEPADAFEQREKEQLDRFDKISAIPGFHVRLGSVTGKRVNRRRQKMVDVQLAVDALTHAFSKNINHATLLSGDLDFKPVVDALVSLGVSTHVLYEAASASRDLYRAADLSTPFDAITCYSWSSPGYKLIHKLPETAHGWTLEHVKGRGTQIGSGHFKGATIFVMRDGTGPYWLWLDGVHGREQCCIYHSSWQTLMAFFQHVYGDITWTEQPIVS